MDNNNKCKVMVENSAPYKVTIKRDDLMELVEIEEDELIPLTDNNAADICVSIQFHFHSRKVTENPEKEINQGRNC
jgi:hypothetical protein